MGNYTNQTWRNENISSQNLDGQSFTNCTFDNCDLVGSSFQSSRFTNCSFNNCSLDSSNFSNSSLTNCSFNNCEMDAARFTNCRTTNLSFRNSNSEDAIDLPLQHTPRYDNSSGSTYISFGSQNSSDGTININSGRGGHSVAGINIGNVGGFGSVVRQNASGSESNSVSLNNNGVSHMPFDPWINVYNDGSGYRFETPGTNITVNGTYTFINTNRYLDTTVNSTGILHVAAGTYFDGRYEELTTWDIAPGSWCEVLPRHFGIEPPSGGRPGPTPANK